MRAVVDEMGTLPVAVSYTPYGVPDASVNGFGFTGEYTDPNGLLYLRARYYDPAIALFTAKDPFEGLASRPMSLNGYLYVEGNPVSHTDPSGMLTYKFSVHSKPLTIVSKLNGGLCSTNIDCNDLSIPAWIRFDAGCNPVSSDNVLDYCERSCSNLRNVQEQDACFRDCIDSNQVPGCRVSIASIFAPYWVTSTRHLLIIFAEERYTDDTPFWVEYEYRAGPGSTDPHGRFFPGCENDVGPMRPFGSMCASSSQFVPGIGIDATFAARPDFGLRRKTVMVGSEACRVRECLDRVVDLVNDASITYVLTPNSMNSPDYANSNTFVRTAMEMCGIPDTPVPEFGVFPGFYQPGPLNMIPGPLFPRE